MLAQQFVERFGIRSFIQEQFLNQPVVPPAALLKSEVALPKNDVLEKDTSMSRSLPDTDPRSVDVPKFQATVDNSTIEIAEVDVWDPPECLPPDIPDDLPV